MFSPRMPTTALRQNGPTVTFGHNRPVEVTFQFLLVVRPVIELSGRYSASKLMTSLPQPGHEPPLAMPTKFSSQVCAG